MSLELTCHACGAVLTSETEDELVELGLEHAREHGHTQDREHVRQRIRRHNPDADHSG
jgi:hypothetical protein